MNRLLEAAMGQFYITFIELLNKGIVVEISNSFLSLAFPLEGFPRSWNIKFEKRKKEIPLVFHVLKKR